ncbi:MAG TPA: hypothetical protein VLF93_06035 [Candidatus Saccharimonadales bacterium]|nr:hypothetical protein [Candidatus Saccharimonadales bacterium]
MAKPHHVNNAKAVIGLLIVGILFVVFYKFITNQDYFFQDPNALRNYVMFAIVGGMFLVALLYLTSNTTHKESTKPKAIKASTKSSKKKKK